jgi:WS/DGAT/MGAT family acyltransferase
MKQLNIQDAGFIYQETEQTPMHICGLGIYNQGSAKHGRLSKAEILRYVEQRIHAAPILKLKLFEVPGDWERPYWVEDQDFKLSSHINHIALPKPGNRSQLNELASQIISRPLDMSKPLWEVHIIEGVSNDDLADDSFAILTKIHHSCIDGGSGNNLISALHDLSAEAEPMPAPANDEHQPEIIPGKYELLARAYASNVINTLEQSIATTKKLPSLFKVAKELYRGEKDAGAKLSVPATRFNRTPTKERVLTTQRFELADIKDIKNAVEGTTVNDVMVCIVAGALRRYLDHYGELPDQSLGAMMPKNIRGAEDEDTHGNRVGGLFASIHTNIEDPLRRLKAIHTSTQKAKDFSEEAGTDNILPNLMGGFLFPRTGKALSKLLQKHHVMERLGPVILNTVITNVPGPNFPLFHAGAQMAEYAGIPPLTDGVGISHAVYSYMGVITLSAVTCKDMMDDPDFYRECFEQSFKELHDAVLQSSTEAEQPDSDYAEAEDKIRA